MRTWISDLEFANIEILFLVELLDDYTNRLAFDRNNFRQLKKKILKLQSNIPEISVKINHQIGLIEMRAIDSTVENEEEDGAKFVESELAVKQICRDFRRLKIELFKIVKNLIREDSFYAI